MQSQPIVSIVIPVYNVEHYIARCLQSVMQQTYEGPMDCIVVDDCGNDRSMEVAERTIVGYRGPIEFEFVHHEYNRGLAAARNTGLYYASGKFVIHVDSDDWLEPDAIELLLNEQQKSNADIVAGGTRVYDKEGERVFSPLPFQTRQQCVLEKMKDNIDHGVAGKLIRMSLYNLHGIRCLEGCDMGEDRFQTVQLSYFANDYECIDAVVYNYDVRSGESITQQQSEEKVLRKFRQEFLNWIGIVEFFSNKEEIYKAEAEKCISINARLNIKLALKYRRRDWYYGMTKLLDEGEQWSFPIGWRTKGIKGAFLHNYGCMRSLYEMFRVVRYFKRKRVKEANK